MKRPPRPVVAVSIRGAVARLAVVDNGAAYTTADVANLATDAGLEPRRVRAGVLVGVSGLPRLEELARIRRVVLQRTKGSTTTEPPAFQPPARPGIDDQAEPTHSCAGEVCRTKGCHRSQVAS